MPTYEYECNKCGHRFEAFQSISEKHLKHCPECNGPVRRLISAGAGLIFKGSGFYITDYKNKPAKSEAGSRSVPPKKDESKSDGKSDKSDTGESKKDGGTKKQDNKE